MKLIKFFIKMLLLVVIGIVFAIGGGDFGGKVLGGDSVGFGGLGLAIGGIIIGYPLGTIVGLMILKKLFRQRGSIWLGLLGAIVGTIATVVLSVPLVASEPLNLPEPINRIENINILVGVFCTIVPALTLGGFYIRKK